MSSSADARSWRGAVMDEPPAHVAKQQREIWFGRKFESERDRRPLIRGGFRFRSVRYAAHGRSGASADLVLHRVSPMMRRVMAMMLVMRRRRKARTCKQQQRNRDSDNLAHGSTLSSMNWAHSIALCGPGSESIYGAPAHFLDDRSSRVFLATHTLTKPPNAFLISLYKNIGDAGCGIEYCVKAPWVGRHGNCPCAAAP